MSEPLSCTMPPRSSSSFEPDPSENQCPLPDQSGSASAPLQSIDPAKAPPVCSSVDDSAAGRTGDDADALECRGSDELVRRFDGRSGTGSPAAVLQPSNPQGSEDVTIVDAALYRNNGGIEVEVGGLTLEAGSRTAGKLTLGRVAIESSDGQSNLSLDGPHIAGSFGTHNLDGSKGFHVSSGANLGTVEGTWGGDGNGFTFGLSEGVGFEASAGVRDSDSDGRNELCWRAGVGPMTLGQCSEADQMNTGGVTSGGSGTGALDPNQGAGGAASY